MTDTAALEARLGYSFRDKALLAQALTHASALAKKVDGAPQSYERLEFLGDRVLGLSMARWLYETYPGAAEGTLASYFAALVGRESLAAIAGSIDLGTYLLRAKNDTQGARGEATILADALEAFLAAIYLDGGLEAADKVIHQLFGNAVTAQANAPRDPKSALQEWAQAQGRRLPAYTIVSRSGPSHAPLFEVEVTVEGAAPVRASGASKQEAEKAAATALLAQLA